MDHINKVDTNVMFFNLTMNYLFVGIRNNVVFSDHHNQVFKIIFFNFMKS